MSLAIIKHQADAVMVKDSASNKINGSRSKVLLQILTHKKQRDNQSIESNRFKEDQYHQENGIGFRRDNKDPRDDDGNKALEALCVLATNRIDTGMGGGNGRTSAGEKDGKGRAESSQEFWINCHYSSMLILYALLVGGVQWNTIDRSSKQGNEEIK
eukprot:scaffold168058_cov55-Attheya_sp.AAC.2